MEKKLLILFDEKLTSTNIHNNTHTTYHSFSCLQRTKSRVCIVKCCRNNNVYLNEYDGAKQLCSRCGCCRSFSRLSYAY